MQNIESIFNFVTKTLLIPSWFLVFLSKPSYLAATKKFCRNAVHGYSETLTIFRLNRPISSHVNTTVEEEKIPNLILKSTLNAVECIDSMPNVLFILVVFPRTTLGPLNSSIDHAVVCDGTPNMARVRMRKSKPSNSFEGKLLLTCQAYQELKPLGIRSHTSFVLAVEKRYHLSRRRVHPPLWERHAERFFDFENWITNF